MFHRRHIQDEFHVARVGEAFRNAVRVFQLVWSTSPRLTTLMMVLTVASALVPAASAWEANEELPRFSVALHGAAALLGVMLEEGISREDIESALGRLLDDIEQRIVEDQVMGGPPQGSA